MWIFKTASNIPSEMLERTMTLLVWLWSVQNLDSTVLQMTIKWRSTKHSIIIYMQGLDLTLSILPRALSREGLMMNRMAVLQQNSGIIGRSTPSALDPRSSILEMSIGLRPRDISRVSGNLSGIGDGFPNTSHVSMEHRCTFLADPSHFFVSGV